MLRQDRLDSILRRALRRDSSWTEINMNALRSTLRRQRISSVARDLRQLGREDLASALENDTTPLRRRDFPPAA